MSKTQAMEKSSANSEVESKRGCRSLLGGCFKYGLYGIILIVVLGLVLTPILRGLGFLAPDVRELYGAAPDLAASQDIEQV